MPHLRGATEAPTGEEIRPADYRHMLESLLREVGLPHCALEIVPSVMIWAQQHGLEESSPTRAAIATKHKDTGTPTIVLAERITPEMQRSCLDTLIFHGLEEESKSLDSPAKILEHLILHEAAHHIVPNAGEFDCDSWAFAHLRGALGGA